MSSDVPVGLIGFMGIVPESRILKVTTHFVLRKAFARVASFQVGNSGKLRKTCWHAQHLVVFSTAHIIPKMLRLSTQRAEFFGTIAYTMAGFEDRCQDIEDPCRGRLVP